MPKPNDHCGLHYTVESSSAQLEMWTNNVCKYHPRFNLLSVTLFLSLQIDLLLLEAVVLIQLTVLISPSHFTDSCMVTPIL